MQTVNVKLCKGQVRPTPINQHGVVIRPMQLRSWYRVKMADGAATAAAKIEDSVEALNFHSDPLQRFNETLRTQLTRIEKIGLTVLSNAGNQVPQFARRNGKIGRRSPEPIA